MTPSDDDFVDCILDKFIEYTEPLQDKDPFMVDAARLAFCARDLKSDRDRLAERCGELSEALLRETQRLATAKADKEALKGQVEIGLQINGSFFEALKPLILTHIDVQNPGRHVTELIHQNIALTQRLAMMGEGFNELVKSYHAMQQTAMKLFDRLDANGLIGADGTERNALLQEISPVDAITSEDIAKAQQALEGKEDHDART